MAIFDNKNFNAQVFGQYIDRIPNLTRNRMIKSGAIRMRNDLATALKDDVGGNFLSTPLLGLVNGDPVKAFIFTFAVLFQIFKRLYLGFGFMFGYTLCLFIQFGIVVIV